MARRENTLTTSLYRVERRGVTRMGNPRFDFITEHGRLSLESDSAIGYSIDNDFSGDRWRDLNEAGAREWHDMPVMVTFTTTQAGRVTGYKIMGAPE